jgi:hypothetical protein
MSSVKDPTKYVRKMYFDSLNEVITVYDGMAPADATGIYVVIDTSWTREGIKNGNYYRFTVNLEINAEFKEYGSSEPVDLLSDQILDIIMPDLRADYPSVGGGFAQNEVLLPAISNAAFTSVAGSSVMAIWQKKLTIVHIIS